MSSKAVETFKAETKRIKQEQAERKKARKGSFGKTFVIFTKGFFHTMFLFVVSYLVIFAGTTTMPNILSYILGGLGFTNASATGAEFIVSLSTGLFLAGWVFLISFILLRMAYKVYIRNMRKLFPEEWLAKIDEVFGKNRES